MSENQIQEAEEKLTFKKLEWLVLDWAYTRMIFAENDKKSQCLKMMSEAGEVADAVAKDDINLIIDGLGDTLVTMIILAQMYGLSLEKCLEMAYKEIKDRKGKMVNGTFVKSVELL